MDDRTGNDRAPWSQPPFVVGAAAQPDWQALADQNEAAGLRRRRLRIAAVAAAVLLVSGAVTAAVALSGGHTGQQTAGPGRDPVVVGPSSAGAAPGASSIPWPSASPSTSPSASPSPPRSAPVSGAASTAKPTPAGPKATPPTALQVISSAGTDTAPLTPATVFPARTLSTGGRSYTREALEATTPCWKATTGGLGNVLAPHGCEQLLRATYVSGPYAVTLGVAVFDTAQQAGAVMPQYTGEIQSLVRSPVPSFCVNVACALTHASVGRYDYFTIAGTTDKAASTHNPVSVAAGRNLAADVRSRLLARG